MHSFTLIESGSTDSYSKIWPDYCSEFKRETENLAPMKRAVFGKSKCSQAVWGNCNKVHLFSWSPMNLNSHCDSLLVVSVRCDYNIFANNTHTKSSKYKYRIRFGYKCSFLALLFSALSYHTHIKCDFHYLAYMR